jgi:hypothetical protein
VNQPDSIGKLVNLIIEKLSFYLQSFVKKSAKIIPLVTPLSILMRSFVVLRNNCWQCAPNFLSY